MVFVFTYFLISNDNYYYKSYWKLLYASQLEFRMRKIILRLRVICSCFSFFDRRLFILCFDGCFSFLFTFFIFQCITFSFQIVFFFFCAYFFNFDDNDTMTTISCYGFYYSINITDVCVCFFL